MMRLIVLAIIVIILFLLALYPLANAQEHHERHHAYYQNWVNGNGGGCCNDQDCGELADADERTTGGKLEVRIEGQWCEVQPWHYLKRGNAPNAASAHVCVQRNYSGTKGSECDRLLCYQPRPGI
jgi:hypothetical protein